MNKNDHYHLLNEEQTLWTAGIIFCIIVTGSHLKYNDRYTMLKNI